MSDMVVEKFAGIDVSKSTLDLYVDSPSEVMHVDYDDKGVKTVCTRMKSIQPTLIVMEATGGLANWRLHSRQRNINQSQ